MSAAAPPRSVADLQRPADRRSVEQKVAAEPVTIRLGDTYGLRILTIAEAKAWKQDASGDMTRLLSMRLDGEHGAELVEGIVGLIVGGHDRMLDLIVAYDVDGQLPARDAIEAVATGPDVEEAFLAVMAVAFPFGRTLQRLTHGLDGDKLADMVRQLVEQREREQARSRIAQRSTPS